MSTSALLTDMGSLRVATKELNIPATAVPWFAMGSIPAPAFSPSVQTLICQYQVQYGWEGLLTQVMNTYIDPGGTFVEGSGDIVWTIDIDIPIGSTLATGHFLPAYSQIIRSLGSLQEQWPIPGGGITNRGWRMKPGETYRYKVRTVQNVAIGAPAFVHASFGGIVWPQC